VVSRKPGLVTAEISRTRYLLRVAVRYDDRTARVSIVESSGLRQGGGRIHRKAVGWILKLETRIRQHLQGMAAGRGAAAHASGRSRAIIASWRWPLLATVSRPSPEGGLPERSLVRPPASSTMRLPAATSQGWSLSSQ